VLASPSSWAGEVADQHSMAVLADGFSPILVSARVAGGLFLSSPMPRCGGDLGWFFGRRPNDFIAGATMRVDTLRPRIHPRVVPPARYTSLAIHGFSVLLLDQRVPPGRLLCTTALDDSRWAMRLWPVMSAFLTRQDSVTCPRLVPAIPDLLSPAMVAQAPGVSTLAQARRAMSWRYSASAATWPAVHAGAGSGSCPARMDRQAIREPEEDEILSGFRLMSES